LQINAITRAISNTVPRIIIALNIEVLPNGPDMHRIGSPVNLEAELGQDSGAKANNEQQNGQQQQLFVQNQPQQNAPASNSYNNNANNATTVNNASARSNNVYADANLFPIKSLNPYQNR
jgi:hypothetical protein